MVCRVQAYVSRDKCLIPGSRSCGTHPNPHPQPSQGLRGFQTLKSISRLSCVRACSVVADSLWPHGLSPSSLLCPWDFPGKKEYSNGLLFPPLGDFPHPGIETVSCSALAGRFFTTPSQGCCCCSVAKSCSALSNPMDCSTPGFPVHHHLPELAQTHAH